MYLVDSDLLPLILDISCDEDVESLQRSIGTVEGGSCSFSGRSSSSSKNVLLALKGFLASIEKASLSKVTKYSSSIFFLWFRCFLFIYLFLLYARLIGMDSL